MKNTILQSWSGNWPQIQATTPAETGHGVLDQAAFDAIEVGEVFEALNTAQTIAGQSVLYRSLAQPLDSLEIIKQKQDALIEIQNNPELKESLERIIRNAAQNEKNFYVLLFGEFLGSFGTAHSEREIEGYGYLQYQRGVRLLLELVDQVESIQQISSVYLSGLLTQIRQFANSRVYSLMQGPVYIAESGLKSKQERKGDFSPAIIFRPSIFKPLLIAAVVGFLWAFTHFFPVSFFRISTESLQIVSIFFIPLLLIYYPIVGGFDRDNCIIPLRDEFKNSDAVGETLDALGQLDELLTFIRFQEDFGGDMAMPEVIFEAHHKIKVEQARNPVLAKQNEKYVGNDFELDADKLVLITGPNSGGKTAFCKTIAQIQMLTQIGCYVPASKATLSVADRIFYQTPEISHLEDGEGRFGTELKRTRDIFLASTARSLVILDELSEGTTFEEKLESSANVLNGFYRKGNSTILITHNHQLVDEFAGKGLGVPLQVEFAEDGPTYKLIPGISRVSHADRVAKKIGFSKEDIDKYLSDS